MAAPSGSPAVSASLDRRAIGVALAGAIAFAAQFSGLAIVSNDPSQASLISGPKAAPAIIDVSAEAGKSTILGTPTNAVPLIWRDFRPGERLTENPSGYICGVALQRGGGPAALIVRLCKELPTVASRRYGLGYDTIMLEASLPGGTSLSYDLVRFRRLDDSHATDFREGPTSRNTIRIRHVSVRDATDVVIQFSEDLPFGRPTISISGVYAGRAFADERVVESLHTDAEDTRQEILHLAEAPPWALLRP